MRANPLVLKSENDQGYGDFITQFIVRRHSIDATQSEVDDVLGVGDSQVARWETGVHIPNAMTLHAWAKSLGCRLVLVPYMREAHLARRQKD